MIDNFIGDKPKGLQNTNFDEFTFTTAKVVDVILNSSHPDYKKMGGNAGLGAIKYEILKNSPTSNKNTLTYALPLISFIKSYPLIGETVLILNGLPTVNSGNRNTVTFSYYLCDVNLFNTPHINLLGKPFKENKYFKEKNEFHPLFALEGDRIIEGRNNQTLRFTTDKDGFPKAILRVTNKIPKQNDKNSFIDEDINIDDSTIIFSSKGKVPIEVAYGNLSSYNINISTGGSSIVSTEITNKPSTTVANSTIDNATLTPLLEVKTVEKEKELFQISLEEVVVKSKRLPSIEEQDDFNVPIYTFEESDKFGLEIVNIADSKDFDQFLYETAMESGIEQKVEIDLDKTPNSSNISIGNVASISQGSFENYLGSINDSNIPIQSKALLEVLAFCEGTMGRGKNGYDILQQVPRTSQCAFIKDWSDNYSNGHPNQRYVFWKLPKSNKMEYIKLLSTASGRYQFINGTWNNISQKTGLNRFSKSNQNQNCDYLIKQTLGSDYNNLSNNILGSDLSFYRVLKKLSPQWDSIPEGNSQYSYNTNNNVKVQFRQKCRINQATIKNLYQRAYNFYNSRAI